MSCSGKICPLKFMVEKKKLIFKQKQRLETCNNIIIIIINNDKNSLFTCINPIFGRYRLHSLHRQFCGHHFLISDLKALKGALSGLRQFLATECPLKIMKNAFHFTSKVLFVLKIFKFLSWLFFHVSKRLNSKSYG